MSGPVVNDWVDPSQVTGAPLPVTGGGASGGMPSAGPSPAASSTPAPLTISGGAPPAALQATDWVDPEQVTPAPVSTTSDVAKAGASGLAVGTAAAAGTPGDLLDLIGNASEYSLEKLAHWTGIAPSTAPDQSWSDVAASNRALTRGTNILPRTGDILQAAHDDAGFTPYQPKTLAGQLVGKSAEFAPSIFLGPGGLAEKAAMTAGSAVGDVGAGAVFDGTPYETAAHVAGSLLGGTAGALTIHGYQQLAPAWSDAAAKANAAGLIVDGAADPAALRTWAASDTGSGEIVPGSKPTSFQASGDLGLGDIERAVQTRDPQKFVANPYGTGTQDQNAAQVAAMQGVQTGGDAMSVPSLFLAQKQRLEDAHDAMSAIATADAQGLYDQLGGTGTPAQAGQAIKDAVDPQVAAARQDIADKTAAIGGQGTAADYGAQIKGDLYPMYRATSADAAGQAAALGGADRLDVYGAGLRAQAADAMGQANARLGDLWDALPGDSAMTLKPVQDFSARLYGGLGPAARAGVVPAENAIADALKQYGPTVPFSEARQVDSLITSSMRQELKANGSTPAYARMVQLKGAYEDALYASLADQAESDAGAVAAGTMDPSQTTAAKIRAATPVPGASPLEARVFNQSVPLEPDHQVVPVNVDKVDALTGWSPDFRIAPDAGGKLDRAKAFISGLPEDQAFKPPMLGVHDQGIGFDDGRHRFAAMRDLGFKTAPASMDPASIVNARRLGLIDDAPVAARMHGAPSSAFTPAGTRVGTDYGVMDLGDLTASHSADGVPNPRFPQELQPRDRSRAASQAQIADMASNLQPERLGHSTSTTDGAPIIGPDGIVESGNGRVLALGRAYDQNGPRAAAYRKFLEGHGFDLTGMDRPVMVRQRTSAMTPEERVAFTRESNAPTVLSSSAPERAAADAGAISDGLLRSYQGGDITSAANRPFVRGFLDAATSPNERGALVAGDGALSREGAARVNNALLHAGYGDTRLVSSLAETGDPDIAAFGRSLADNAGRMAQLRRGIAAGEIHPGADLSDHAVEAARVVQRARATGQPLASIVDQADAFSPVSREAHALLQAGYGEDLSGRFSRARMNSILSDALGEAHQQEAGARLFGEPLEAHDLLQGARTRYGARSGTSGAADPIADGARDPGAGAGEAWPEGGRPGARPGRPEGTGRRQSGRVLPDASPSGPPLSQEVLDAQAIARQATKEFHGTFRKGVGGDILRSDGTSGSYRLPDAGVGAKVFPKGPAGFQAVRAYERMVGDSADAAGLLHNYAAATLRKDALRPDGTLDPAGYQRWRNGYGEAFRALPPSVQASFDTAGHAAEALDRFGRFTPETAAALVPDQFFRPGVAGADGVEHLRSLIGAERADPVLGDYAASSLRRAAARPDGTIDPGRYATWRRNHGEALGALGDEVRSRFDTAASAGDALKRFGHYSPDLDPASVPELFFAPGKAGREGVEHFRNLVGDEAANTILSDHIAERLKAKATTADNTLDPTGLKRFMAAHEPAMSAFPELAGRFGDAAKATQTISDVAAGRAAALKNLQTSAAGKFMGLSDPSEVRDAIGRMVEANNVTGLRGLMRQASADPAATEGVKRAALDHVLRRGISDGTEAGTSGVNQVNRGTFQTIVGKNRAALGEVFDPEQMKALDALSADMTRQKRTENALKVKGSPNSAADYIRAMKFEPKGHGNLLREVAEGAIGGEELAGEKGALTGAALAVGNRIRSGVRDAALRNTYDHIERAVLDPDYLKTLLMSAPIRPGEGSHRTLATKLARYSMFNAAQADAASQGDGRSSR